MAEGGVGGVDSSARVWCCVGLKLRATRHMDVVLSGWIDPLKCLGLVGEGWRENLSCVCMTVASVCVCVCVLEGLSSEINRPGPLSCFHKVLLI